MDPRIAILQTLAEAAFEREAARLRDLRDEDARLAARARDLRIRPAAGADIPIAVRAAASEPWERWRRLELARLEARRAALAPAREEALQRTRIAFGRSRVLLELGSRRGPGGPAGR